MPKPKLPRIRTFQTDSAEVIRKGETSLSDIYQRQQKRKSSFLQGQQNKIPINQKSWAIILSLIALATIAGLTSLYFLNKKPPVEDTNKITQPSKSILPNQEEIILEATTRENFEKQLNILLKTNYDAGILVYLPIKKETSAGSYFLNSKIFLNFLNTNVPVFLTSFLEEDFLLGIINLEKNYPILIFKTEKKNYDSVFAGMLTWEENLLKDLNFLLAEELKPSDNIVFSDKIIKNQSARIVEKDGQLIFLYTIFNKSYLIITNSPKALEEIIEQFVLYKFS